MDSYTHLKPLSSARPGDKVLLGQALGSATLELAHARGLLRESGHWPDGVPERVDDQIGALLACLEGVHALDELEHGSLLAELERLATRTGLTVAIHWADCPILPQARECLTLPQMTDYRCSVFGNAGTGAAVLSGLAESDRILFLETQRTGNLLVCCTAEVVTEVLSAFLQSGLTHVSVIGELRSGSAAVTVDA